MKREQLPTKEQLNPIVEELDGKLAAEHLLGKSVSEAALLLQENSLYYSDDYLWMGPEAFVFYAPALVEYLESPSSDGDGLFAYATIRMFCHRLENEGSAVALSIPTMRAFCKRTVEDFDRLDFEEKYRDRLSRRISETEAIAVRYSPPDPQ